MEVLLMYIEDHCRFDSSKVKESFRSMDEVVRITEADWVGDNVECVCRDETHIRLSADCEVLAIQGDEVSSLNFAIEIQREYGGSFHLTDPEGHFDTIIDGSQQYDQVYLALKAS
jgi:hypothetical protein